jgi:gliding motility-associated-like protein
MKYTNFLKTALVILFFISNIIYAIDPPKITATSNPAFYCPGTNAKIVANISITYDPAEPETVAMYIQISSGYVNGQDILELTNLASHPSITASWDSTAGKLKLSSPINGRKIAYTDFVSAIKDITYRNSSANPSGARDFSITIGQANYLPRNKHFYQYFSSPGISWTAAKTAATSTPYYGLRGYLATLTAADEAALAGAQADGTGWIGGSDAETEGTWKWVTGPEGLANGGTGTTFWIGGNNGTKTAPFYYANWNGPEEPNDSNNNEDYAHITAKAVGNPGTWNDLAEQGDPISNYNYYPKGYIVEYGGLDPGDVDDIQISASTTMIIAKIIITTPSPVICASTTTTLQAASTAGLIKWYNSLTNVEPLGTGNSYTTPTLYSTTTYYIDNGCSPRTPLTVTVESLPTANSVEIQRQCDDNQDGKFTFNTVNLESDLLNGQSNVKVTYFDQTNNPLKDLNGNLISSPFPASFTTTSQTIKAVVTNTTTLKCSDQTSIQFTVDVLPQAFEVPTSLTTTCDDEADPATQDGIFTFDTSTFESIILGGQSGMTVSYTLEDGSVPPPLSTTFTTVTQTVLVTVTNPANSNCGATTTLNFVVNPKPIVKDVTIVQCDSDTIPDGKTLFNLTIKNNEISINYTNENLTYYTSQSGANSDLSVDLISNELTFENTTPSNMEIWARVENKITGCFSVAKLTLKVPATNISPATSIIVPAVCDDFLDTNGNDNANNDERDGITAFDFLWTKTTIEEQLTTTQTYNINYYRNQADALAELNVITDISNYRNIGYPNSQDIWVRIESSVDNSCLGLGPYITLNVEPLPFANPLIVPRQCDEDQDGIVTFDTSSLESDLLNSQSLSDVTVSYFDQNNDPLPSPFPSNFTTKTQTIKAVVTNNSATQCNDETFIQFVVDISPQAFPVSPALTMSCDDELDPSQQDGKLAFDTSTFEAIILGGQSGMTVTYLNEDGNTLSFLPNPFITGTQNVLATVTNPFNPNCTATTTLNFIVHPVPNIDLNMDGNANELVCSNLPNFFVTLDAGITDNSPTSNYEYVWTKDGANLTETLSTLGVNAVGIYSVEVINSFGCSRIRTINVSASNVATINGIDIIDLTDVNTITVNTSGPGDYEYSLDSKTGLWQDSNFFDNVPAGIYEIFVKDKNGCGIVSKTIAVIGAPKFFTPNNDGYNDYWAVKGLNSTFNSKSIIYIFDRYGKLLKQWAPYLNEGWDGTFNGQPLKADDYWFTLKLEDGRQTKGHFTLKR